MNVQRLKAIARKEFIHVLRDPRALGVSLALPLVLLLLFGYALTLDVDRVPLLVWDQSQTAESRDLIGRFEGSRYFQLRGHVDRGDQIDEAMDRGDAMMGLVIPNDFGRRVASDRATAVQVLADGSDANTATLAMGYAEAIVRSYSQERLVEKSRRMSGQTPKAALDLRARAWFNTDMESRIFIVPGLIAVIVMLISAVLTSLTVAREWEVGTMEQLISTPVRGPELILGKLAPYFALGVTDLVLSVLAGRYLFDVPLRGSLWLLTAVSLVYLVGALALGILISTLAKRQLLASQMAFTITFLPAFLLSGFMFDIGNMPRALQVFTYLVPARYYIAILRGLYLKGTGLAALWPECLSLVLFSVATLGLAIATFRKRLE
ncbi:MAG TPA: ABC transporter permease [Holophaga sp.]|jgi:ABC-2 type transport system permease protein|nr:ABC transporter permease [Holophaga sp.]